VGPDFTHNGLGQRFGLLCKPFAPTGLLDAVRSAIKQQTSGASGGLASAS
jgi:hypothetical protein